MLILQIFLIVIASYALAAKLNVVHEWKYIDYEWESENDKKQAILENRYNYELIFTIDVQNLPDGRTLVTTPQFSPGSAPASLSTISKKHGPGGPLLRPYPNWSWHNSKDCRGMKSVWRVAIDDCGRLFVLDSGKIGKDQVCPAQILVFDPNTDILIKRIIIPDDLIHNSKDNTLGNLITPVVETEGPHCERTYVYVADVYGGLLIIHGTNIRRLEDKAFLAEPEESTFNIAGDSFDFADGLFTLALTPKGFLPGSRRLFFRPLASLKQYSYSVKDLHRSINTRENVRYTVENYTFPSQVSIEAFSDRGILFFGLTAETAIGCWNIATPFDSKHVDIVAQDNETLQFASGIKLTKSPWNYYREEIWISTNRFQKIALGTMNFDEVNFRILKGSVDDLVQGTKCRLRGN